LPALVLTLDRRAGPAPVGGMVDEECPGDICPAARAGPVRADRPRWRWPEL